MARKASIPATVTRNDRRDYHIEIWPGSKSAGQPGTGYMVTFGPAQWNYAACFLAACHKGDLRQYLSDLRSACGAVADVPA